MTQCPHCGLTAVEGADFCNKCGAKITEATSEVTERSDSPVDTPAGEVTTSKQLPVANVGKRLFAGIIDVLVMGGLVFPLYRIAAVRSTARWALVPFILPCLYILLRDAIGGRSIGKFFTGLVCYNTRENKPANFADSIIRNWFLAIIIIPPRLFFINLGMFLFAMVAFIIFMQILFQQKQRIGDGWANTQVVDARFLDQGK